MKNLTVIEKLKILLFIKVTMGSIITIFFDIIIGIIILIAGVITLLWIIKTKGKTDFEKEKSLAHLHIIVGLLMFFGVLIMLLRELNIDIKVIIKTLIGCLLILKGTYEISKLKKYF